RSDHRLDAGLPQREHVRVPLDDDRALLFRNCAACTIEAVQQIALSEELTLGRVDVLRADRIVLSQLASLKAEHASACVRDGKEQPPGEVVVAAPVDEPRREKLLAREAFLQGLAR